MKLMIGSADIAILEQASDMKNIFYQKVGNKYLRIKPGKLYEAIAGTKNVFKFLAGLSPKTKEDIYSTRLDMNIIYLNDIYDMGKDEDFLPKIKMNFVVKYGDGLKPFSFSPGDFMIYQGGSNKSRATIMRDSSSNVSEIRDDLFIEVAKFIWYMSLTGEGKQIPEGLPDNSIFLDNITSKKYWDKFGEKDLMSSSPIRNKLSGVAHPDSI
jgi:hypothetical protein